MEKKLSIIGIVIFWSLGILNYVFKFFPEGTNKTAFVLGFVFVFLLIIKRNK